MYLVVLEEELFLGILVQILPNSLVLLVHVIAQSVKLLAYDPQAIVKL